MSHLCRSILLALTFPMLMAQPSRAAQEPAYTRTEDVIYGRKHGTALTMDVFTPKTDAKGVGLVLVVSGGWYSAHEAIPVPLVEPMVRRGYTVFAVVHGSQPKFTIPEILGDMNRAVRFIRHHAEDYGIDPDRIGIYGGSAGGHLSLMQGVDGDEGDPDAEDPVDRTSSRVQAVACLFPPTDFLNYGMPGEVALGRGILENFKAPFDFHELDPKQNKYVPITEEDRVLEIGRDISPVYHVGPDDPPTLIVHGDADTLVPIQQAELMVEALEEARVEAKLIVKPGAAHGWPEIPEDLEGFADWFDEHLIGTGDDDVQGNQPSASRRLVPQIEGAWWQVAGNPDLGVLTGEGQQPVDFGVWQAADGTWQLWSCIRKTNCGGKTRLFYRWEGASLTEPDWTPMGIAMQAQPDVGETAGGLQAPHVIRRDGTFLMFYGDWQHIALSESTDGKLFRRRLNRAGSVGLFDEGPGSNTRDAMVLPVGDRLFCYYTAHPEGRGAVYCRLSEGDPTRWGESTMVAFGGRSGTEFYSAECPHVVFLDGYYYLFRTQRYGEDALTNVYRSEDPLDFGVEDDRFFIGSLPVAAPEIILHEGDYYIAALNPGLDGIRIALLRWVEGE